MAESSPAVERAAEAARELAAPRGEAPRLGDWLTALLREEWGRPAELLGKLDVEVAPFLEAIAGAVSTSPVAPDAQSLFAKTREFALALRGESELTTDLLLLATVAHDDSYRAVIARLGLDVAPMEAALRSERIAVGEASLDAETFVIIDSAEATEAARIVDVNLNRARESLRILDDYCRFILDDAFLTGQFKRLRHQLVEAGAVLPQHLLLGSRDTRRDVGTELAGGGEYERSGAAKVAAINAKRLQESLRSLEEFGKVLFVPFAKAAEAIRYEAYTLEQALVRGSSVAERLQSAKLYVLLTGSQCEAALDWTIAEAAAGGASIFQMREKDLTDRERLDRARRMRVWTRKANALFIVNDRPDLAKVVEADGVHLGQDDLNVSAARRLLGPEAIIGVSTHTINQAREAILDGADYLGIGPTFPSDTKDFADFPGLDFIREVSAETTWPVFALGGITLANVREVVAAGGRRIAVSAAIVKADDPAAVAQAFSQVLNAAR